MDDNHSERQGVFARWIRRTMGRDRGPSELHQVIDESEQAGIIDHEEGDMIEGIFELQQTCAREIMVPRINIVAASVTSTLEQLLTTIIESGHSRIPVYTENVDHVIGVINAKDLLPLWLNASKEFKIEEFVREPYFIPETKRVKDLLNELRSKKSHLAVIVDEYGGTAGLVTIEDIVEEIIGEIRDEHDVEEEPFIPQEDGSIIVNAWVNLDDFEEHFDVTVPRGGYDTLGGFIVHMLGRVPRKGEDVTFEGLKVLIQGGDQKRITRVRVSSGSAADPESQCSQVEPMP